MKAPKNTNTGPRPLPALQPAATKLPGLPGDYPELLEEIKLRIRNAQVQAGIAANQELLLLYYGIGRDIHVRLETGAWGTGIVNRLAADLQRAFPGMPGFSPRNLRRMRVFYRAYQPDSGTPAIWPQAVAKLESLKWPPAVAKLPWAHNIILLEKCKDPAERNWYGLAAVHYGWSRSVLVHQIESGLYQRKGKAPSNFTATLPKPQSDLAAQTLKDPYLFDFLDMTEEHNERGLENALVNHIQKFLVELGVGFAFVGRQTHLEVDGADYYLDLLFYHLKLRCYVVIELKAGEFKPEYAGKMSFYLSAVDDTMRHPDDKPTIGLILCKSKKRLTVEYTLRDIRKPVGVSEYKLTQSLPKDLQASLPSIKEIEKELGSKK
ncbi:MAG TPA: DUF1016 domain-containing protein [Elusimicrobia bacterium]|nr:DUF1016 domain-containing protein [Elusimicrobiota bacterium]